MSNGYPAKPDADDPQAGPPSQPARKRLTAPVPQLPQRPGKPPAENGNPPAPAVVQRPEPPAPEVSVYSLLIDSVLFRFF